MPSFWNGNKRINELGAGHFHTTNIHYMEVASRKRIKGEYKLFMYQHNRTNMHFTFPTTS